MELPNHEIKVSKLSDMRIHKSRHIQDDALIGVKLSLA